MMLSAGRSRRISIVPMIQSYAQLQRNYGNEGAEIIVDNCQVTLFSGFAPQSESSEKLSKALGSRTVLSGSVSRGKNDPSESLQMMERPLMTADELKNLPKGQFVVMKTGAHPMQTTLRLFLDWGIKFGDPYEMPDKSYRTVLYADKEELEDEILLRHPPAEEDPFLPPGGGARGGGMWQSPLPPSFEQTMRPPVGLGAQSPKPPMKT